MEQGFLYFSRGGRIRTYDLVVPNDARYRAALHPEGLRAVGAAPRREFQFLRKLA